MEAKQLKGRMRSDLVCGALAAAAALFASVWATSPAAAHDPSKHKAKATYGEVVRVAPGTLTLKSEKGEVIFVLGPETTLVEGEKAVGVDAMKPGTHVAVFGTKLPDGRTAATEVNVVGALGSSGKAEHGVGHDGHE